MSDSTLGEAGEHGLTRRDLLRKGAVLGGALAWSIPTIQTLGMAPAFAAATSFAISYIAVVVKCGDDYFRGKYEVNEDGSGAWESGDTSLPCEAGTFRSWPDLAYQNGAPAGGFPSDSNTSPDRVTFNFGTIGCEAVWTLNKCGSTCVVSDGLSSSSVTFTPCPNPNA